MSAAKNDNLFLGVDGGQSHTEAVIADGAGNILGRGFGGPSNHAEQPGGRERLQKAVMESVGEALQSAGQSMISQAVFKSAHFGMTGGADFKEEIISAIVSADILTVGHDAPTALFGATAGKPGIVVIAGTGSVVYGESANGETVRAGGLGFLFSDEGSGFWLATQVIRLAIKEQDGLISECGLERLVLEHFEVEQIRDLTTAFYNEKISRDHIASFAEKCSEAASENGVIAGQIRYGAEVLANSARVAAKRLELTGSFPVAGVGGMFGGELMRNSFIEFLAKESADAEFTDPRFGPAIGALLVAYKQADIKIEEKLLLNLEKSLTL